MGEKTKISLIKNIKLKMKRYTKAEMQEIADERGDSNTEGSLFATSDGQFFVNKNYADLHKRQVKDLKIFDLATKEVESAVDVEKLDYRQRIELVKQLATVEDVEAFLEGETADTVKKAGEERIVELNGNTE